MSQTFAPGLPAESQGVVAEYEDRFGETRTIHKTRHGLQVLRNQATVSVELTRVIGPLLGVKIRQARIERGLSMAQLCVKAGLMFGPTAKHRMYEIEKGSRRYGIRFGTLYALAAALGMDPAALLPSSEDVFRAAKVVCRRKVAFQVQERPSRSAR